MDILSTHYLFREVKKLPILTNRAQELWLGIQIRSPQKWQSLLNPNRLGTRDNLLKLHTLLYEQSQTLEDVCVKFTIPIPHISYWISDVFAVRNNIYGFRRSKLRRYLRRIDKLELGANEIRNVTNLSYKVAELLVMLPNVVLHHVKKLEKIPPSDVLESWIDKEAIQMNPVWQAAQQQAKKAKQDLVIGYLRYALRMARNHVNRGIPYLDLVQAAFLGLMRATDKYNYQEKTRFATYASTWIWQRINRKIANQSRTIRVPVHAQTQIQKIQELYAQLWEKQKRAPTFDELLMKSGYLSLQEVKSIERHRVVSDSLPKGLEQSYRMAARKLRLMIHSSQPVLSLDAIREKSRKALNNHKISQSQDLVTQMTTTLVMKKVYNLLSRFSERNQRIFRMRFGLETGKDHTLAEVGEAFNVSRERIRQIETRILNHLANSIPEQQLRDCFSVQTWPLYCDACSLLGQRDLFPSPEQSNSKDWDWLDRLLAELPGGDWHRRQDLSKIEERLVKSLLALQEPAHYSDIAEQLNDMLDHEELDEKYIYSRLFYYEESFILLGEGVFSLMSWERKRAEQSTPVLPFCPTTPLAQLDRDYVFLESVLVAREMLKQELTVREFLEGILAWAGIEETQTTWFLQSMLSVYYLVGVIPYIFYPDAKGKIVVSTVPDMGLQDLRRYCLRMMTKRLMAMPEFWWLIQRYEPARACEITEHFVDGTSFRPG